MEKVSFMCRYVPYNVLGGHVQYQRTRRDLVYIHTYIPKFSASGKNVRGARSEPYSEL